MRTTVLACSLFFVTALALAFSPIHRSLGLMWGTPNDDPVNPVQNQAAIEVVFVLDTTGSMSGLIQAAKEKIWSIASTMASAQNAPVVRMGLVAYRDRGDDYVTQVVDLSGDLDAVYAQLMDFQANGGGDVPESVNRALYDAVNTISWSQDEKIYRAIFLVGDAPPQLHYQDEIPYPQTLAIATRRGIHINTIQCGEHSETTRVWQHIASLGEGEFFQVAQNGGAIALATPYDKEMARLAAELDATRLYYGSAKEKAAQQIKLMAGAKVRAKASSSAQARRAEFNLSKSGEKNFLGENELLNDLKEGRVKLAEIERDELPAALQNRPISEAEKIVEQKLDKRQTLKDQLQALSEQRQEYVRDKLGERETKASLDQKIFSAVKAQAERKGFHYESDSAKH